MCACRERNQKVHNFDSLFADAGVGGDRHGAIRVIILFVLLCGDECRQVSKLVSNMFFVNEDLLQRQLRREASYLYLYRSAGQSRDI